LYTCTTRNVITNDLNLNQLLMNLSFYSYIVNLKTCLGVKYIIR